MVDGGLYTVMISVLLHDFSSFEIQNTRLKKPKSPVLSEQCGELLTSVSDDLLHDSNLY